VSRGDGAALKERGGESESKPEGGESLRQ